MVKRIINKRTKRGMAVLMAAAMVGTMSPVSLPTQPTWTVQAATKVVSKTPTVVSATAINYAEETLELKWNTGVSKEDQTTTVYYAIASIKGFSEADGNKFPKASAYEAVESDAMDKIDLSWVNWSKADTYLFVTTDTDVTKVKPAWIKLATQNTKLKISYSGSAKETDEKVGDDENGYLIIDNAQGKNPDNVTFDKMEYRTENGKGWKDVVTDDGGLDLKRYTSKGATLQLRVKATATNPAGKTFKVKVSAKAKGPKVTVDYLKQTVKLAKDIQIVTGSATQTVTNIDKSKWSAKTTASVTKKLSSELGYGIENGGMKIFVRTAAKGKKAPSKVTVIKLGAPETTTQAAIATEDTIKPVEEEHKISIEYKTPYDVKSGIQLTNKTVKPIQFAIVEKNQDAISKKYVEQTKVDDLGLDKLKWTTVSAGKAGTISKIGKDKISADDAEKYMVIYRTADKKATVISQIAAAEFPKELKQEIIASAKDVTSVKAVTACSVSALELDLDLPRRVKDSNRYTVAKYEAKDDNTAGNTTSKITATVTTDRNNGTGKLSIKGGASAKVGEKYVVTVKCEGAELSILVTIGEEDDVCVSGEEPSTGGSGEEPSTGGSEGGSKDTFASKEETYKVDVGVFKVTVASSVTCATVEKLSDRTGFVIKTTSPGQFTFTYDDNSEGDEHTVSVTIADNGSITVTENGETMSPEA